MAAVDPATLLEFRAYAPELASVPDATVSALLPRAHRWAGRQLAAVTTVVQADAKDAQCARLISELAAQRLVSGAEDAGGFSLGDLTVNSPVTALEQLRASGQDYEASAWAHLHDAGLPRPKVSAGAAR